MRVFKTKWFVRFARKERIEDRSLCVAVREAEEGLVDASLGGGVIKKRVARKGEGKSGGFRTFILFRKSDRAILSTAFQRVSETTSTMKSLRLSASLRTRC